MTLTILSTVALNGDGDLGVAYFASLDDIAVTIQTWTGSDSTRQFGAYKTFTDEALSASEQAAVQSQLDTAIANYIERKAQLFLEALNG